jgi:guanyl-specific ribonuclease Sa
MSINAGKRIDTMTPRSVALCGSVGMVVLALVAGLVACSNRASPGQSPAVLDRAVTHPVAARAVRHQFSAFSLNDAPSFITELPGAGDSDLDFNLSGNGVIECSETGCSINVDVVSQVIGTTRSTKVVGGQVTANLTVDVEVEGQGALGCTSTDFLPLNGAKRLSCQDAQAGPVIVRLLAEKKAQAEAESEAAGGAPVSYTVNYGGHYFIDALAEVDVLREGRPLSRERLTRRCPIGTVTGSCDSTVAANPSAMVDQRLSALPEARREQVRQAIDRARAGRTSFQGHDGKVFRNDRKQLPLMPLGYYHEWPAAASSDPRGADRIIVGGDPRNPDVIYYWDHEIKPVGIYP